MATKTKNRSPNQDNPNRIQDDYDQKFDDTNQTFNEMTSPENYDRDGEEPDTSKQDGEDNKKSLHERESQPDKNDVESNSVDNAERQQVGGEDGFSYQPDDGNKTKVTTKIAGAFAGKRKWGWIGGGFFVTFLSLLAILAPTLGPLHIFNNFFNHNFEMNDSFRRQRTSRIVKSIFNFNRTNRQLSDTPFKLKADLVAFEKYESRMQSRGWSIEYDANNKPIGLIDPDGAFVNLDNLSASEFTRQIDPMIKDTIPAWQMTKRVQTRSLISTFTGPRRSFSWTKLFGRDKTAEPNFEAAKFRKEIGAEAVDPDTGRFVEFDPDSGDPIDSSGGSAAEAAQEATIQAKLDGASDSAALRVGVTELNNASSPGGGRTSIIFGTVIVGCIAYSINENQVLSKFERYAAALRYGSTFMLATNEMQQGGDIDVGEVGELFGEYNKNDPTQLRVSEDGSITEGASGESFVYENGTSFAESAAFQRATGSPVVGPEINEEFRVNPTGEGASTVNSILNGAVSVVAQIIDAIPGFDLVCRLVNSGIGFLVGLALDITEGVAALAACLTGAGCVALGKFVVAEALFEMATRLLSASISSFAGYLTDNPAQAAAILDQSLSLISSEETRTATAVDDATYNQAVAQHKRDTVERLPFAQRYFDIGNPASITHAIAESKLAISGSSPQGLLASLFTLPRQTVAMAVSSNNVYAQDIAFDNYDFQKYMFDPAYLEVDAYDHAEAVYALIEADESIVTSAGAVESSDSLARDFAVLCMGYNPVTGSVNKSNNTSMLPMFSDPSAVGAGEATRRNDLYTALCVEAAGTDGQPELYAQVGRFVDDLEIIQSMEELSRLIN